VCGACGTGRLPTGRRLRVTPWRGGYLTATATGGVRPVASLDEFWAAPQPSSPRPPTGKPCWARATAPFGRDVHAAVVCLSAGTVAAAELPGSAVGFPFDGTAYVEHRPGTVVGVLGPDSGARLADLLRFSAQG
jgi:hypothetical protein